MPNNYYNPSASQEREDDLQKAWAASLPCADCPVRDICRHAGTFKRIHFDHEVFDVRITCKRRESQQCYNGDAIVWK